MCASTRQTPLGIPQTVDPGTWKCLDPISGVFGGIGWVREGFEEMFGDAQTDAHC